ncbi:MAG: hypothetical protein QM638_12175 [Nocardioides sp.]|uniref:hypothetical protein n=1 Tax=Nocardioides sp. TaxID=35761 RepID=UPI0039E4AA7F
MVSMQTRAWPLFDEIVKSAPQRALNPWDEGTYRPDFDTLCLLLAVPLHLGANTQSRVPALALDVWVAYELRRAGLDPDAVWPREEAPRVIDTEILRMVRALKPQALSKQILDKLKKGTGVGGVAGANANMLGKNYFKQVDVVMTSWKTGPELMISTKRMDSSFGKNMQNRVEESYGDAKNLSLRHPLSSIGFFYALRSTAYDEAKTQYLWLVDMLTKLGREEDAYDACCLVMPQWAGAAPADDGSDTEDESTDEVEDVEAEEPVEDIEAVIASMPTVTLRHELVPEELSASRFFKVMVDGVLDRSPISQHKQARHLRSPQDPAFT